MILLNQYITFCIANLFAGISTGNTIFQTFDCFLTIHESKFFPCFYYCFITFFFCHKTTSEVHCDAVYSSLCISQHLRLLSRHCHIGNRYSHCSSCRILIPHSLDAIQYFCSLSSTMDVDNLFKDLL